MLSKLINLMPSQAMGNFKKFRGTRTKIMKLSMKINFNKQCLSQHVIPNYAKINLKINSPVSYRVQQKSSLFWIKSEIREAYKSKDILNNEMYNLHLLLSNQISPLMFAMLLKFIDEKINFLRDTIADRHQKKIISLVNRQSKATKENTEETHKFYPRVVNLTDVQLNRDETSLLNKGPKYNLTPALNQINIKRIIADVKVATQSAKLSKSEACKIAIQTKDIITKEESKQKSNKEYHILKSINNKLEVEKAIIIMADKGNTLVITSEDEYISKTLQFFNENNINEISKDPTTKFQNTLKKLIDNNNFLLLPEEKNSLKIMNPQLPKLRSQFKLHKQNIPIRPIVNNRSCPSYKLNRKLNEILKSVYIYEENFNIKNSFELAQAIYNIDIPADARFASLDVKNLYTNIPIKETIDIIKNNLIKHKIMSVGEIVELVDLLECSLAFNYFSFNNKIYHQADGLAMGNSLAGTLADIFVNYVEVKFFKENPEIANKIIYYKRYVDDTLLLYRGSKEEIDTLAATIGNIHPKLSFTVEHETVEKRINFLDMTISNKNGKHYFAIYRKPTATDAIINATSCHPWKYKRAFFCSMIHRLLKLPLAADEIKNEIAVLKQIAKANDFNPRDVDVLFNKLKQKSSQSSVVADTKFIKMTYMGNMSDKINRLFKNTNVTLAFTTNNLLQYKLKHTADNKDGKFLNSGVYKVTCNDCDRQYIGQTGRNFVIRYREHTTGVSASKSVFGQHLLQNNHSEGPIQDNLKVLHNAPKGSLLNALEQIEIFSHQKRQPLALLNEQLDFREKHFFDLFDDLL